MIKMITDVIKMIEEEIYEESVKKVIKQPMKNKEANKNNDLNKLQLTQVNLDRYKATSEGGFLSHFRAGPSVKGYLYLAGGKIAGGVAVEKSSDGNFWIQALQVATPFQKKGYGTILLKDAMALGATHLSVRKTNKEALHMYLKAGFKAYKDTGYQYLMSTKNMGGSINVPDPIQKNTTVKEAVEEMKVKDYIFGSKFTESVEMDGTDCVINLDNFERGLFNFILVIGLPGSGKGTFGRELSKKYNAKHLEIDIFDQCGNMSDADIKSKGEPFTTYILSTPEGQWYRKNAATLSVNEKLIGNRNFIEYCIAYCKSHKDQIFVIDGTPIYAAMEPEDVQNYPIIIKGTTAQNSFMNKVNRDINDKTSDKKLHSKVTPESLNGLLHYYWGDDQYLAKFKSELRNKPDVVKESIRHESGRESDDDSEGVCINGTSTESFL